MSDSTRLDADHSAVPVVIRPDLDVTTAVTAERFAGPTASPLITAATADPVAVSRAVARYPAPPARNSKLDVESGIDGPDGVAVERLRLIPQLVVGEQPGSWV
jgi:hypothetical protein